MESLQPVQIFSPPRLLLDTPASPVVPELNKELDGNVGYVASMGITGILYLPGAFIDSVKNLAKAVRYFDAEATIESVIRTFNIPLGLAYAVQKIAILLLYTLQGIAFFALNVATYIVGCFFVAFELILEAHRLYHLMNFREQLNIERTLFFINALKNGEVETLNTHRAELEQLLSTEYVASQMSQLNRPNAFDGMRFSLIHRKLEYIQQRYFDPQNSQLLQGRLNFLARKIRPWLVREIHQQIPHLLPDLTRFDSDAADRATTILEKIDSQTNKAKKMYIVGLIALSIALIVFAVSILFSQALSPLLITAGLIGTAMEFGRWFAPETYLDQKSDSWNWDPILPSFLKRKESMRNLREPSIELNGVDIYHA